MLVINVIGSLFAVAGTCPLLCLSILSSIFCVQPTYGFSSLHIYIEECIQNKPWRRSPSQPSWRTLSADFVGRRRLRRPKAEGRFGDRRRRRWDLNPRTPCGVNTLAPCRTRPLCDSSKITCNYPRFLLILQENV